MNKWTLTLRAGQAVVAVVLLLVFGSRTTSRVTHASEDVSQANPAISDVEDAFDKLTRQGEWLGFYMGDAPDTYPPPSKEHVQGIARSPRTGIPPVFYVTRSGNKDDSDFYGSLMVVQFDSRDQEGERLRSNRLDKDDETPDTEPLSTDDKVIRNISFPDYQHPGGIQMVGDILAVPLEDPKDASDPMGKVIFYDASAPTNPQRLDYELTSDSHNFGVIGMTKLSDGRFFLIATWGNNDTVEFYRSNKTSFFDAGFEFQLHTTLDSGDLNGLGDYWVIDDGDQFLTLTDYPFQSLNFVNQTDDSLYLVASRNNHTLAPMGSGLDLMYLLKVTGFGAGQTAALEGIRKNIHKQLSSPGTLDLWSEGGLFVQKRQQANFNAGDGVYVSPTGELLYYATSHYNKGPGDTVTMAELRHGARAFGPQFRPNHLGGPYTINEGESLTLNGEVYVVEPWVNMYQDSSFQGIRVTMDWADQSLDNFHDFKDLDGRLGECQDAKEGFNDCMTSFRWSGPVGSTLEIFDDDANESWEEAEEGNHGWISCQGTGGVVAVSNVASLPSGCQHHGDGGADEFNDEATAARIRWDGPGEPYAWDLDGDGAFDDATGSAATFTAGAGNALNTVWMSYDDEDVVSATIRGVNVPPTVTRLQASEISNEGSAVSVKADFTDAVISGQYTCAINYGDGTGDQPGAVNIDQRFCRQVDHAYADNGVYLITVRITDQSGGADSESASITVLNVLPSVTAPAGQSADEGAPTVFALGAFGDPGDDDPWQVAVNWGDGSPTTVFNTASPGAIPAQTHTYADGPDTYTVQVTVAEEDGAGASASASFVVTVNNVAPSVTAPAGQSADEGAPTALALGAFGDPGDDDPWQVTVNWGDGSPTTVSSMTSPGTIPAQTHTYADGPDTYTVQVTVAEENGAGASASASFVVTVNNVAPSVTAPANQSADEGALTAFALGAFGDPGDDDPWQVAVNWGDGSPTNVFNTASPGAIPAQTHTYADGPDTYTVQVTVAEEDGAGASASASFVVTVNNVAPSVTLHGPATANEGDTLAYTLTAADPGDDQFLFADGFPTCGGGGVLSNPVLDGITGVGSFVCTFPDGPADSAVAIQVKDGDEAPSNYTAIPVAVSNVIPSVRLDRLTDETGLVIGVDVPIALVNTLLALEGQFSDPGPDAPYAVSVDWDDGALDSLDPFAATGVVSASHVYATPGHHTVTLHVTDKDGGVGQSSVVIIVLSPGDALEEVIEMLTPLADDPNIADALEKLQGQKNGKARNGALDLLQQGNLNAALEKIAQALQELEAAEAADPTLDLLSAKALLALAAKSVAVQAIDDAESVADRPGEQQRVAQALQLLAEGNSLLAWGTDVLGAVNKYQEAVRQVQGLP